MSDLSTSDRLDDVGIGILAAPYAAKGLGGLLAHSSNPRIHGAGDALKGFYEATNSSPAWNLAGLGLVAPTITHGLGDMIDGQPKTAGARAALRMLGLLR